MGKKFGAILVVFAVHLFAGGASAAIYHLTDLGTLGGDYSEAHAINSSGQVVGFSTTSDNHTHAFVYSAGSMSDLGGGVRSQGDDIDEAGQIVGFAMEANQPSYAFRYSAGAMTNLGTLGGLFSHALGMNASGQVVGQAYTADNVPHAFLSSGIAGQMVDLGALAAGPVMNSEAFAINDSGQIVGDSRSATSSSIAFVYSAGHMTPLGTLGGPTSAAFDNNNLGEIVGYADTTAGESHAFRFSGGHMTDLGTLGGSTSHADAINNLSQIVGTSKITGSSGGLGHGFIDSAGQMRDLNDLVDASGADWIITEGTDINDTGQIAAVGLGPLSQTHALLLTPIVPEPGGVALLASLLLLCRRSKRRRKVS